MRTQAATPATTTGTDVIKSVLQGRLKRGHAGTLAPDLQVSIGAVEEFAFGDAKLQVEVLKGLARELFDHAEYDPDADLLRILNPPTNAILRQARAG
jgi:hypothetical protein